VCLQVVRSRLEAQLDLLDLILQLHGAREVMGQEATGGGNQAAIAVLSISAALMIDDGQELGTGWGAVEDLEQELQEDAD